MVTTPETADEVDPTLQLQLPQRMFPQSSLRDTISPGFHAAAGAAAGVTALAATYPLLTLSMRLQVAHRRAEKESSSSSSSTSSLLEIVKKEGVSTLFAGVSSALYGQLICQFVYYYAYAMSRRMMGERSGRKLSTWQDILSASIAGLTGATVTNPLWVINARKVVDKTATQTTFSTAMTILHEEGPAAFMQGIVPAYFLVINPIIAYVTFESLKKLALRFSGGQKHLTSFQIFILSSVGKWFATCVTYPYILTKTRLQANTGAGKSSANMSLYGCFLGILEEEGARGLYKGLRSKLYQSVLTTALLFVLHDRIVRLMIKLKR